MADVNFNIDPFKKLLAAINKAGSAASSEPLGWMFTQWGNRYMTFTRVRYKKFSMGGGNWRPLKSTTTRRRKKARKSAKGKRRHAILVENRTLFNALSPEFSGHLNERLREPAGVRVGFGNAPHDNDAITIRELAVIHDQGLGHMPQRQILVKPDAKTVRDMMSDSHRATQRLLASMEMKGDIT